MSQPTPEATVIVTDVPPTITGHRFTRNKHREPVLTITLVGQHRFERFAKRMLDHQSEFQRMGRDILAASAEPSAIWQAKDDAVDGFRKFRNDRGEAVVEITLVHWHSIHRFAYNMLGWQVEFGEMGQKILKSHRRAVGPVAWREIWAMYHGAHETPMTFTWRRDV